MSIEAIKAVSQADIRPCGRKFTLLALADFADANWSCFPKTATLASYTGQSDRAVRTHLAELEKEGFLTRFRPRREDGKLAGYRYKLQRQKLPVEAPVDGEIDQWQNLPEAETAIGETCQNQRQNSPKPAANISETSGRIFRNQRKSLPVINPHLNPQEKIASSLRSEACQQQAVSADVQSEIFIHLPTKTGDAVAITRKQVDEWSRAFPALDVEQKLRAMKSWLDANPSRRKTANGVPRFVVAWLSKDQDRSARAAPPAHSRQADKPKTIGEIFLEEAMNTGLIYD
ncbi:helix-turn-helix domain-containing protein [Nitratireductor sp. GISD-1A_MAKvit]|uniref:helix-turn-helix domain-containing protein n=1 Tax=Nitratireductor sp. GISD-1A_MAKvit TaxID=3234198 RepID=UPI003466738D